MIDFCIKGSGFKAIYFALKLREKYPKAIISINTKNLGGIYSSIIHKNFYLDIGCHLFDFNDQRFINIFKIKKNKMIQVRNNYASINEFGLTENYAIYDFRNHPDYKKIKKSFFKNVKKKYINKNELSLYDYYYDRYGEDISKIIEKFCLFFTGQSSKSIDSRSKEAFPFQRLLMFNNDETLILKQSGYDDVLAADSKSIHDYSSGFIAFTFENGNAGFLSHINDIFKIEKIEIDSASREAKFLIDLDQNKSGFEQIQIPLHLVYFLTESFPYDYVTDYSNNPVYRISSAGHYSKQFNKNKSYICVEITDPHKKYNKDDCLKISEKYLSKFCKSDFLYYTYFNNSYPVFKCSDKPSRDDYVNFFRYSKNSIMDNIDNMINNLY